jgi:hypothetical protein
MQSNRQASPPIQEQEARSNDHARAWMRGQRVRILRSTIEDLDRACAQVRSTIYVLRKELGQ